MCLRSTLVWSPARTQLFGQFLVVSNSLWGMPCSDQSNRCTCATSHHISLPWPGWQSMSRKWLLVVSPHWLVSHFGIDFIVPISPMNPFFSLVSLAPGLIVSLCSMTFLSTPIVSAWVQAKRCLYFFKRPINAYLVIDGRLLPKLTGWFGYSLLIIYYRLLSLLMKSFFPVRVLLAAWFCNIVTPLVTLLALSLAALLCCNLLFHALLTRPPRTWVGTFVQG